MVGHSIKQVISEHESAYQQWQDFLNSDDYIENLLYPLSPLLEYCYIKLNQCFNKSEVQADVDLVKQLTIDLFKREISNKINRCLVTELHQAKKAKVLKAETARLRFLQFIEIIATPQALLKILEKYSPLKNVLLTCMDQFIYLIDEFLTRLQGDFCHINTELFKGQLSKLHISDINVSGDKHHHGKRVLIITLSQQSEKFELIYKPRNLSLLNGLAQFIAWINANSTANLKLPKTLHMGEYGWQQYIHYTACENKRDGEQFYYKLGAWLAIFHLLNSQDIHGENIIAMGSEPVLVDCECLLTPVLKTSAKEPDRTRNLVISALVLPNRIMSKITYSGYDNSVIGYEDEQTLPFTKLNWEDAGTDTMRLERVSATNIMSKSRPYDQQGKFDPASFKSQFIAGFKAIYLLILHNKDKLLSDDVSSPLACFNACHSRVIFRPTIHYSKLLIESFHPVLLHNLDKRNEFLSTLDKTLAHSEGYQPIITSERNDISESNIPIFNTLTTDSKVYDSNRELVNVTVIQSGMEHVKFNLANYWSESDLAIQSTIIENSFATLHKHDEPALIIAGKTKFHSDVTDLVNKLGNILLDYMIHDGDLISWPTIIPAGSRLTQSITENTLYNGNLGIIYTCLLIFNNTNDRRYYQLVESYLGHLQEYTDYYCRQYTCLGLYEGISGLLFLLNMISKSCPHLNAGKLISYLLLYIKDNLSEYDDDLSISSGYAGLLISLLSLDKSEVQDYLINYTAEKILTDVNLDSINDFLHGNAGMIYALSNLYTKTKHKALQDKAKQVILNAINNPQACQQTHNAWCNGTIGNALPLIYCYSVGLIEDTTLIKTVIQKIVSNQTYNGSSLCHGHAGYIDFLLLLKQRMPQLLDNKLYESSREQFLLQVSKSNFHFLGTNNTFIPGLFDGLSGIIYTLLRMQDPNQISSILMVN